MYDFGHPRTVKQFEIAWSELRTALGDDEAGLLLAMSGDKLLLDGTPLESSAAERSFARMLSAAGIASVHFSPKLTHKSLARFARGFPTGTGALPGQLRARRLGGGENDDGGAACGAHARHELRANRSASERPGKIAAIDYGGRRSKERKQRRRAAPGRTQGRRRTYHRRAAR
jgi:hypothetical protein